MIIKSSKVKTPNGLSTIEEIKVIKRINGQKEKSVVGFYITDYKKNHYIEFDPNGNVPKYKESNIYNEICNLVKAIVVSGYQGNLELILQPAYIEYKQISFN